MDLDTHVTTIHSQKLMAELQNLLHRISNIAPYDEKVAQVNHKINNFIASFIKELGQDFKQITHLIPETVDKTFSLYHHVLSKLQQMDSRVEQTIFNHVRIPIIDIIPELHKIGFSTENFLQFLSPHPDNSFSDTGKELFQDIKSTIADQRNHTKASLADTNDFKINKENQAIDARIAELQQENNRIRKQFLVTDQADYSDSPLQIEQNDLNKFVMSMMTGAAILGTSLYQDAFQVTKFVKKDIEDVLSGVTMLVTNI